MPWKNFLGCFFAGASDGPRSAQEPAAHSGRLGHLPWSQSPDSLPPSRRPSAVGCPHATPAREPECRIPLQLGVDSLAGSDIESGQEPVAVLIVASENDAELYGHVRRPSISVACEVASTQEAGPQQERLTLFPVYINPAAADTFRVDSRQAYVRSILNKLVASDPILLTEIEEVVSALLLGGYYAPVHPVARSAFPAWCALRGAPTQRFQPPAVPPSAPGTPRCAAGATATAGSKSLLAKRAPHITSPLGRQGSGAGAGAGTAPAVAAADVFSEQLVGIKLQPCWWTEADGVVQPGIALFHGRPAPRADPQQAALRCLAMVSQIDSAVTLMAPTGRVVFQNALSRRYFGRLLGRDPSLGTTFNILRRALTVVDLDAVVAGKDVEAATNSVLARCAALTHLFGPDDTAQLQDMLDCWAAGKPWKRLLQVPASVRAAIQRQAAAEGQAESDDDDDGAEVSSAVDAAVTAAVAAAAAAAGNAAGAGAAAAMVARSGSSMTAASPRNSAHSASRSRSVTSHSHRDTGGGAPASALAHARSAGAPTAASSRSSRFFSGFKGSATASGMLQQHACAAAAGASAMGGELEGPRAASFADPLLVSRTPTVRRLTRVMSLTQRTLSVSAGQQPPAGAAAAAAAGGALGSPPGGSRAGSVTIARNLLHTAMLDAGPSRRIQEALLRDGLGSGGSFTLRRGPPSTTAPSSVTLTGAATGPTAVALSLQAATSGPENLGDAPTARAVKRSASLDARAAATRVGALGGDCAFMHGMDLVLDLPEDALPVASHDTVSKRPMYSSGFAAGHSSTRGAMEEALQSSAWRATKATSRQNMEAVALARRTRDAATAAAAAEPTQDAPTACSGQPAQHLLAGTDAAIVLTPAPAPGGPSPQAQHAWGHAHAGAGDADAAAGGALSPKLCNAYCSSPYPQDAGGDACSGAADAHLLNVSMSTRRRNAVTRRSSVDAISAAIMLAASASRLPAMQVSIDGSTAAGGGGASERLPASPGTATAARGHGAAGAGAGAGMGTGGRSAAGGEVVTELLPRQRLAALRVAADAQLNPSHTSPSHRAACHSHVHHQLAHEHTVTHAHTRPDAGPPSSHQGGGDSLIDEAVRRSMMAHSGSRPRGTAIEAAAAAAAAGTAPLPPHASAAVANAMLRSAFERGAATAANNNSVPGAEKRPGMHSLQGHAHNPAHEPPHEYEQHAPMGTTGALVALDLAVIGAFGAESSASQAGTGASRALGTARSSDSSMLADVLLDAADGGRAGGGGGTAPVLPAGAPAAEAPREGGPTSGSEMPSASAFASAAGSGDGAQPRGSRTSAGTAMTAVTHDGCDGERPSAAGATAPPQAGHGGACGHSCCRPAPPCLVRFDGQQHGSEAGGGGGGAGGEPSAGEAPPRHGAGGGCDQLATAAGNSCTAAAAASEAPLAPLVWHEVSALPVVDPLTGHKALMLIQADVTARVEAERRLVELTAAQTAMLEQMFPRHVLEFAVRQVEVDGTVDFSAHVQQFATAHEKVTILFTDIVGFTTMSKEVPAAAVMAFLSHLYSIMDALVDAHGVFKVETAGDCYIVAGGVIEQDEDGFQKVIATSPHSMTEGAVGAATATAAAPGQPPLERGALAADAAAAGGAAGAGACEDACEAAAEAVFRFALEMLEAAKAVRMPHNGLPVQLRVGIHSGPIVSGVIGTKMPKFALFGDTMNTASRMESTCPPGCVQLSDAARALLPAHLPLQPTGGVNVKGKGVMSTYLWLPPGLPHAHAHAHAHVLVETPEGPAAAAPPPPVQPALAVSTGAAARGSGTDQDHPSPSAALAPEQVELLWMTTGEEGMAAAAGGAAADPAPAHAGGNARGAGPGAGKARPAVIKKPSFRPYSFSRDDDALSSPGSEELVRCASGSVGAAVAGGGAVAAASAPGQVSPRGATSSQQLGGFQYRPSPLSLPYAGSKAP